MDERAIVLTSECSEPEGKIIRNVRLGELSFERLKFLWEKLKDFDVLFPDHVRGDFGSFINHFVVQVGDELQPTGLIWDVDDVGIFILRDIRPAISASVHYVFWDKRFKGREQLCRDMLRYAFNEYKFRRISTEVPLYAYFSMQSADRIGFVREGRLRKAVLFKDEWFDINIYSILPEDLSLTKPSTNGGYKSLCANCGNVFEKQRIPKPRSVTHGT